MSPLVVHIIDGCSESKRSVCVSDVTGAEVITTLPESGSGRLAPAPEESSVHSDVDGGFAWNYATPAQAE